MKIISLIKIDRQLHYALAFLYNFISQSLR